MGVKTYLTIIALGFISPEDRGVMEWLEYFIYTYWYLTVPAVALLLIFIVYRKLKSMPDE